MLFSANRKISIWYVQITMAESQSKNEKNIDVIVRPCARLGLTRIIESHVTSIPRNANILFHCNNLGELLHNTDYQVFIYAIGSF